MLCSKEFVLRKSSAGFKQFEGQPIFTYCKQCPFQAIVLLLIAGHLSSHTAILCLCSNGKAVSLQHHIHRDVVQQLFQVDALPNHISYHIIFLQECSLKPNKTSTANPCKSHPLSYTENCPTYVCSNRRGHIH